MSGGGNGDSQDQDGGDAPADSAPPEAPADWESIDTFTKGDDSPGEER